MRLSRRSNRFRRINNRYMGDKAYLETVYRQGAERAGRLAERTLSKAMKKNRIYREITPSVCFGSHLPKEGGSDYRQKLFSPRRGENSPFRK